MAPISSHSEPHLPAVLFQAILVLTLFFVLLPAAGTYAESAPAGQAKEWQLGERVLNLGSWGADVFALQIRLRELGYSIDADGMYGAKTKESVAAFQRTRGVQATGVVGPKTIEALRVARLRLVETTVYTVQPGDSLWSIARDFDTSMQELVELNELEDRPLRAGESLKVPALIVYTVRPGDTLWGIAREHHTSVEAIAKLNELSPKQTLAVGITLKLPRDAFALVKAER